MKNNKLTIRNLLVPIDFSPLSLKTISEAHKVARHFGAVIHLAHVYQQQYPSEFMVPVLSAGQTAESVTEHQRDSLGERLADVIRLHDLPATTPTHLCEGASIFHEICRLAQSIPVNLIVMPTHGHDGFKHVVLGSTAERIVQHAPCPVLIVRPQVGQGKNGATTESANEREPTILVPIDFSPVSLHSLQYALAYAADAGAKVLILHTIDLQDEFRNEGRGVYRLADFRQTARRDAERELHEFLEPAEFGDVPFEILIRTGKPAPEICRVAEHRGVDLIILGTHGRTGLKHLVMGSIAEHVVRSAAQSVLVVPSHPETRISGLSRAAGQPRGLPQKSVHQFVA